jgi:hypothetical protein
LRTGGLAEARFVEVAGLSDVGTGCSLPSSCGRCRGCDCGILAAGSPSVGLCSGGVLIECLAEQRLRRLQICCFVRPERRLAADGDEQERSREEQLLGGISHWNNRPWLSPQRAESGRTENWQPGHAAGRGRTIRPPRKSCRDEDSAGREGAGRSENRTNSLGRSGRQGLWGRSRQGVNS